MWPGELIWECVCMVQVMQCISCTFQTLSKVSFSLKLLKIKQFSPSGNTKTVLTVWWQTCSFLEPNKKENKTVRNTGIALGIRF